MRLILVKMTTGDVGLIVINDNEKQAKDIGCPLETPHVHL